MRIHADNEETRRQQARHAGNEGDMQAMRRHAGNEGDMQAMRRHAKWGRWGPTISGQQAVGCAGAVRRPVVSRLWAVQALSDDQWSAGCGLWSVVSRLWAVVSGQQAVGCGQWSAGCGLWSVVGRLWAVQALCLNGTLSCVDFVDVIMVDIHVGPAPQSNTLLSQITSL